MTAGDAEGIVLAGGRSSRFGRDKLAEPLDGEPLLWRPIRALVAAGCAGIVIVIGPEADDAALPPELGSIVRFARDPEPFGGPLVGLRAGLAASEAPRVVVVAGDQPRLRPELLGLLRAALGDIPARPGAVVLVDRAGVRRPLPCALDRRLALAATDDLLAAGKRRLRAVLDRLEVVAVEPAAWLPVDPDADWTHDVDAPEDLPETNG
ncbi:MAG: molybdenum cofactor guanylyltransferase [Chloroflexota bacterium]|nr:molybdenum cofactor guanylyltransferase [Chloroflexota bacterium]